METAMEKLTMDQLLEDIDTAQKHWRTCVDAEAYALAEKFWEKRGKLVDRLLALVKAEAAI